MRVGAFARVYGAGPLHLLAGLASFAIAAYAALEIRQLGAAGNVAFWFVGAIVAHDLLLLPVYALVHRIALRLAGVHASSSHHGPPPRALALNHLLVPAMVSGLLFVLFFPSILQRNDGYVGASGLDADVYLVRWLALSAALFVASGLLYAVRHRRATA